MNERLRTVLGDLGPHDRAITITVCLVFVLFVALKLAL